MSKKAQALNIFLVLTLILKIKCAIIDLEIEIKGDDHMYNPFNSSGMTRVGFPDPEDKDFYESHKVTANKYISKINSQARNKAKLDYCILCNNPCSSFCNSHSIPQFALRRIAENGTVHLSIQGEIPILGDDLGIKKAGTFHVICNKCDNDSFQDYENPKAYENIPEDKILAQIALKNHLCKIGKRKEEIELYELLSSEAPLLKSRFQNQKLVSQYDLNEFLEELRYAKKALSSKFGGNYYLCFFKKLNYVVPFTAQDEFALISDFDDVVINDIFNHDPKYIIKNIHFMVLPLETSSVVMVFIRDGEKRYKNFYRQLNKLPLEEQLSAINYIIFSYTENVFLSPSIHNQLKKNKNFMDVCRKTTNAESIFPLSNKSMLSIAIKDFSLSHRNEIPNLLSEEYSIK